MSRQTKIQLDKEYRLESDSTCWTLIYDVITGKDLKTGKDKRRYETWYYASLEVALRGYRDIVVKGAKSVDDLLKRIDQSDKAIHEALEDVKGLDRVLHKEGLMDKGGKSRGNDQAAV